MSMGFLVPQENAIAWRGLLIQKALQQLLFEVSWPSLDVLVLDLPPGTGDVQLTILQSIELAGAAIISTPQTLALRDAVRGIEMFRKMNVPLLGMVQNMSSFVCGKCGTSHEIFGLDGMSSSYQGSSLDLISRCDEPLVWPRLVLTLWLPIQARRRHARPCPSTSWVTFLSMHRFVLMQTLVNQQWSQIQIQHLHRHSCRSPTWYDRRLTFEPRLDQSPRLYKHLKCLLRIVSSCKRASFNEFRPSSDGHELECASTASDTVPIIVFSISHHSSRIRLLRTFVSFVFSSPRAIQIRKQNKLF